VKPLGLGLALLAAFVTAGMAAATAPGYYVDSTAVRASPPAPREETTGQYTCTITRQAPDAAASRLLAIAECSYPPRALLAGLADSKGYEIGSDTARVPLWWCKGTGERRIPYAATRGALEYYLKLTEKYRDRERREPGSQRILTSGFEYHATISLRDEFALRDTTYHDVYVASIAMSWTYDDGIFLPFVAARRTVVLGAEGEIKAVDGDGQEIEDVAISANRGIGRQQQLGR
jgi:hypothetical protein